MTRVTREFISFALLHFEQGALIKPPASRTTNYEIYLVLRGYDSRMSWKLDVRGKKKFFLKGTAVSYYNDELCDQIIEQISGRRRNFLYEAASSVFPHEDFCVYPINVKVARLFSQLKEPPGGLYQPFSSDIPLVEGLKFFLAHGDIVWEEGVPMVYSAFAKMPIFSRRHPLAFLPIPGKYIGLEVDDTKFPCQFHRNERAKDWQKQWMWKGPGEKTLLSDVRITSWPSTLSPNISRVAYTFKGVETISIIIIEIQESTQEKPFFFKPM